MNTIRYHHESKQFVLNGEVLDETTVCKLYKKPHTAQWSRSAYLAMSRLILEKK